MAVLYSLIWVDSTINLKVYEQYEQPVHWCLLFRTVCILLSGSTMLGTVIRCFRALFNDTTYFLGNAQIENFHVRAY